MSFIESAHRDVPRASCAPAHLRIATSVLVAFLTTFGFSQFARGELIANLQPISGVSGMESDPVSYSIADIDAAGGILIGDKLFDSFSVTSSSSPNALAPTASSIRITGVEVNGDYGFKADALWTATGGQWVDTSIVFHASILPASVAQGHAFDGDALYITAVAGSHTTGGIASISENLYAAYPGLGGPSFADESTYYVSQTDKYLRDTAQFAPVTDMWVVKDVGVSGGVGTSGAMAMSEFYQTFEAPEPSALALAGIGVMGFAGFAWRRRRSALFGG